MEPGFLEAYRAGHKLYTLRSNVNTVNSEIYTAEDALEHTRKRIVAAELALINSETTTDERVALFRGIQKAAKIERVDPLPSEVFGAMRAELADVVEEMIKLLSSDGKAW